MRKIRNFFNAFLLMMSLFILTACTDLSKIQLSFEQEFYQLVVGEKIELQPNVENGELSKLDLIFKSGDETIVIYKDGNLEAISAGEIDVQVYLKKKEEIKASVKVIVSPKNIQYNVKYNLNGGVNNIENKDTYFGLDGLDFFEPLREGYKFLGWFLEDSFNSKVEKLLPGTSGDIELFAKWEAVNYSIHYHLDGGINNSSNKSSYTINDTVTLLSPTKRGYTFKGWFLEPDFQTEVKDIPVGSSSVYILYAKWEIKVYKINYHLDGGINNSFNKDTLTIEDLPFEFLNPTKENYLFIGWYKDSDFLESIETIHLITRDIDLFAKWERVYKAYNINYSLDGGINHPNNPSKYQENLLPVNLYTPTKDGYEFLGWYNIADSKVSTLEDGLKGDIELFAKWEKIIIYEINYVLNGGINHQDNPDKFRSKELPLTLNDPTKEGYIFMGWFKSIDFSGEKIESITEEKDLSLYAYFITVDEYRAYVALYFAEYSRLDVDVLYTLDLINNLEESSFKQELLRRINNIDVIEDDVIRDDSTIIE